MLKSICWQVVSLVGLTLLIVQVAFSFDSALAQEVQASKTPTPEAIETVSPQPTGKTPEAEQVQSATKPETEQKTAVSKSKVTYPQPPDAYNREAIEQFNEELYGN